MGIYTRRDEETLKWSEQHLYGSSRLGIWRWEAEVPAAPPVVTEEAIFDSLMIGMRQYELSNHLGNVLATISDKKVGHDSSGVVDYYVAEVLSQNDYYPGGMLMPGRTYQAGNYAYGFGGKRKDNEMYGEGNAYDFEARIFDPRVVRWLSVDPLFSAYPHQSPYVAMSNNLINRIDPTGMGDYYSKEGKHLGSDGKTITVGKGKKARQVADDKAYVAESVVLGKNGLVTSAVNSQELSVSNSTLNKFANTVAGESSGDKTESYALASAIVNISKHRNKTILGTLQTEGIYGYRDGGNSSTYKNNAEYSMEAAINALTGGTDYSYGAIRWDGFDLAAKGFSHVKPRTYGVEIGEGHFNDFKAAWPDKKIKAFSGGKYTSFASDFSSGIHLATEGDNTGRCLLKSTAVHGRTIFWGINRDPVIMKTVSAVEIDIDANNQIKFGNIINVEIPTYPNKGFKNWKGL